MKKRKPNPYRPLTVYTLHDELMASDSQPLPQAQRTHHLGKMHLALHAMEQLCLMLCVGLDRAAVSELIEPLADDIQLAWVHWVAFP